ncbi:MAG TPA: undecaprenyl-diphosphate phosphatase [Rhabdochlamydiaceae bacterium]|jgi:undecaprenyl-diphosphatase|nr:undecaprenyl-diphosphate phosphatase [Rhabdochlamydiaceae bacterium]
MNWLHALLLGLIQGVTEFFPVSSSAHLKAFKTFFHLPTGEEAVLFDLFCHLGTLLALIYYFRRDILEFFYYPRRLIPFMIALVPLVPFYFLLKPLREALSKPEHLGFCLIGTATILLGVSLIQKKINTKFTYKDALFIGTLQGLALIPGISRSAATIGAGLLRGVSPSEAVRFSFLLSIPAVSGGTFLELLKAKSHLASMPLTHCLIGFATAAATGLIVVRFAIPLLQRKVLRPFAGYCLIAGILLTVYL